MSEPRRASEVAAAHHHESRDVSGLTAGQLIDLIINENIPADAVLDAEDSDRPMIAGPDGRSPGFIPVPVLTWSVSDED